jgi:predicted nucleic acid-binding protein
MMMPDVNLLVAFSSPSHPFHDAARAWFDENPEVVTCAITELGMLRVLIQIGTPPDIADAHLENLFGTRRKTMLPCDLSGIVLKGKISRHGQVTDSYLVEICKQHRVKLATFDKGISDAVLVPIKM